MKYGIWNTALPDSAAVDALQQAGYSPLTARVLAGRGCGTPQQAQVSRLEKNAIRTLRKAIC